MWVRPRNKAGRWAGLNGYTEKQRCYAGETLSYTEIGAEYGPVYGRFGAKIPGAERKQLPVLVERKENVSVSVVMGRCELCLSMPPPSWV